MLIRDKEIIRISVLLCLMLQFASSFIVKDRNYRDEVDSNFQLLIVADPELQSKIDEAGKNPAFVDPEFCSIKNPSDLRIIRPDNIVLPLNDELTLEDSKRFSKYFQDEFISDSSILDSLDSQNYNLNFMKLTTNNMSLVENEIDDDYITVALHNSKSVNSTRIKAYFMTKKVNIVMDSEWYYDFTIKDDFAFCYFCNSNFLKPQVCNIRFEAKTGGALNTIDLQAQIYASTVEDDMFTVLKVHLRGGSMAELNFIDKSFQHIYIILPIFYIFLNYAAFKDRDIKDVTILSSLGYGISSLMINSYFFGMEISLQWLNVDAYYSGKPTVGFILSCIVAGCCALSSAALFSTGVYAIHHDMNETSEVTIYFFFICVHFIFYTFTISFCIGNFGPFMLYNIYMSPTMCFLLGNVYIIPIVCSAVGNFTLNDYAFSIIWNWAYLGSFMLGNFGPKFWADGFDGFWFCLFMSSQIIYAIIVRLQYTKGPRFFCPTKSKRHTHLKSD